MIISLVDSDRIEWEHFAVVMEALLATLQGFSTYMQVNVHYRVFSSRDPN